MSTEVGRLRRLIDAARSDAAIEMTASRPDLNDTLFVQLLHEAAADEAGFENQTGNAQALLDWAAKKTDSEIAYLLRLHRTPT